jgi:hypothetical protein
MKIKTQNITRPNKGHGAPHLPRRGGMAFGGGTRAFNDPSTMESPDQAFGAAMAMPQGASGAEAPGSPAPETQ